MQLTLKNILPTYFEQGRKQNSGIWGKDLHFSNGDLIKIVAPSGTGKTSLIHFLYRMRIDFEGSIFYDNKSLKHFSNEEIANLRRNQLSVVLQDMRLFGEQTLFQNLEIKRQLNPFHPPEKIAEMAERLGIATRLNAPAKNCSYGEQQRAVIIRALLQPFDFLLMDEPFSHLDEANARKAMELIMEEVQLRRAGVIFAELERVDFFPATQFIHL
ncbi:MAG TPA: ATP-binding cassette domain-containing protein [Niabella sp.]|nr:ATP-binding cassette domain-containing protein [Niabella sp.]HUN04205.1 ATP-binding cassette domain-containing protein [Niabella sp.]